MLTATAATVVLLAASKVGSPQFMAWLIPLIPLAAVAVRGTLGGLIGLSGAIALLATQWEFPSRYFVTIRQQTGSGVWAIVTKEAALLCLLGALVAAMAIVHRRDETPPEMSGTDGGEEASSGAEGRADPVGATTEPEPAPSPA